MIDVISYAAASALSLAAGTPVAGAPTVSTAPAAKPVAKRYCVDEASTGSRMPRRTCRTRAEWLADGFDPLAAKD